MFKLTFQQLLDLLDLQVDNYDGEDREVLIAACNLIYEHKNRKKHGKKKTKKK